ncbi:50S ribosomal protein L11 [Candidatus Bathyarchaeota archaeon]|jgi:large subunit ribosomal protein L11|nr:MAG: 50S ribosomal protein L11 [Candidatus Bathyarchaeota archaeon]
MGANKVVEILVNGGHATAGPPLGPALGPLGLNVLAVVKKINELTDAYVGMKVPVKVEVDVENKTFNVTIGTPTTSALLVKELSISKGSGTPNTEKVGNLTVDQLIHITKLKREQLFSKNLKAAVKEILGSCVSVGITVNDKEPRDIQREIDEGLFDDVLKE